MAPYRFNLLLEERLAHARAHLNRLPPHTRQGESVAARLYAQYRLILPHLNFDLSRKQYLAADQVRLIFGVPEGEVYLLEELLAPAYRCPTPIPYKLDSRPAVRELWVEYRTEGVAPDEVHTFPEMIFTHLSTLIGEILSPEIEVANRQLKAQLHAMVRP
jgi:hypothetical protein